MRIEIDSIDILVKGACVLVVRIEKPIKKCHDHELTSKLTRGLGRLGWLCLPIG